MLSYLKFTSNIIFIAGCLLLQSCMSEMKPALDTKAAGVSATGYAGCTSATPLSTSSIKVNFTFPSTALEVSIYRDGIAVLTTKNQFNTSFTDVNLLEGEDYHYECVALVNDKYLKGEKTLDSSTIISHSPTFTGIESVTALSPTSVRVKWPNTDGGAVAKEFRLYTGMNASVDFTKAARISLTAKVGVFTADITDLADDMPYKFAIRACTSTGICDSNTKEISLTMADNGAAKTLGATSATIVNAVAQITAPWSESLGAVAKRRLYRSRTNDVNSILGNLIKTVDVGYSTNLNNPSTILEDNNLEGEGVVYYYIVRDEDPSGNISTSSSIVTVVVGDLIPPTFNGLTGVAQGVLPTTRPDTDAVLTWTPITNQPYDSNGTTYYLLYRAEATMPASPANACTAGTLIKTLNSSDYTQGVEANYIVSGLSPRKKYSFCMKAEDAAFNISRTPSTSSAEILMADITAPSFDGIQGLSYDTINKRFSLLWNPSSSSDIYQYKVTMWKNPASKTTFTFSATTNASSAFITESDFPVSDSDTVYVKIDACDNAAPAYNSSNNCTSFADSTAKSQTLTDTSPPPLFAGVSSVTPLSTEGKIKVDWTLPADKSDYAGFIIYDIAEISSGVYSKNLLRRVNCLSDNCSLNPITTYTFSTNHFNRDYRIFVSAVDKVGNETNATLATNLLSTINISTLDSELPQITTALTNNTLSFPGFMTLSWGFSDNQDSNRNYSTTNALFFDVYRKLGDTPFTYDGSNVPTGGRIARVSTTQYKDNATSLIEANTYRYVVCAVDASNNAKCSAEVATTIPDVTNPIINEAIIAEGDNAEHWNLNLKVSDGNSNAPSTVSVNVTAAYNSTSGNYETNKVTLTGSQTTGTGTAGSPTSFTFYTGTLLDANPSFNYSSADEYVNLTITATDANHNSTTTHLIHRLRKATLAPTNIAMLSDTVLRVSGVRAGETVQVFSDSTCSTMVDSGVVASGTTKDFTVGYNSNKYYANAFYRLSGTSSCTTLFAQGSMPTFLKQMGSIYSGSATVSVTEGNAVATDRLGYIYIAGTTKGSVSGNASEALGAYFNTGIYDGFIAKFHPLNGDLLWVYKIGAVSQITSITGIAIDSADNIIATGYSGGNVGGSPAKVSANGIKEVFVVKLNNNLSNPDSTTAPAKIWSKNFHFDGASSATLSTDVSIAVDATEMKNIYVVGKYDSTSFLYKFDKDGNEPWMDSGARYPIMLSSTNLNDVTTDTSGNVYVVGDTTLSSLHGASINGSKDALVVKYSSSETYLHTSGSALMIGVSTGTTIGYSIKTQGSNIFVGGSTTLTLPNSATTFTSGTSAFVSKYDNAFAHIFTNQLGTTHYTVANDLALDSAGNIYVGGNTFGSLTGSTYKAPDANFIESDAFLAKFNESGTLLATKDLGGVPIEGSSNYSTTGKGIAIGTSGNVYLGGITEVSLGSNTRRGAKDFFLAQFPFN